MNSDTPYTANYDVEQTIPHPEYDSKSGRNDIGIVRTSSWIRMGRGVSVCVQILLASTIVTIY